MRIKEKAEKLHKKVNTFILSCVDSDGYPLTKAVVPGKYRDSINELYFATNTSSKFVAAISENSKATVYFYSRKLLVWQGCTLKGIMEIVSDLTIKEKFWQEKYKNAYLEKSFRDPDFCLLKFTAKSGRLYANFSVDDFDL
ncbi:MAG: pyridoxamine 5'-phosphate oxidase family protein [Erysipelotrichales bacterium]|nr:pyridoxamine 5'-phosphate oxidase family protein [Erysipelotrichales bacterium]